MLSNETLLCTHLSQSQLIRIHRLSFLALGHDGRISRYRFLCFDRHGAASAFELFRELGEYG